MNKNFLFSICLLVGAFSMKGQYKNAVNLDLVSFRSISLDYERFLYSENKHHFSMRGGLGHFGMGIGTSFFIESNYGFGKHHRIETGIGAAYAFGTLFDKPAQYVLASFRLNYAYFAKNNPMIYRIGWMPTFERSEVYPEGGKTHWEYITIGIGYRF